MLDAAALREHVGAGSGMYVVNAARGGVLDEAAALEALRDGRLAGLALDTLEQEPVVRPELLVAAAGGTHGGISGGGGVGGGGGGGNDDDDGAPPLNVLLSPHAAFYSDEAFLEMRTLAAREVRRVLRGEEPWYRLKSE